MPPSPTSVVRGQLCADHQPGTGTDIIGFNEGGSHDITDYAGHASALAYSTWIIDGSDDTTGWQVNIIAPSACGRILYR